MLMTVPPKVTRKGKDYYTIAFAARLLGTNAEKARELMGRGELDWTQLRVKGRPRIPYDSISAYQERQAQSKR
jgi:hypothetical protein